jgi:RimJ/RimL family protein N-acetyltransferase
MVYPDEVPVLTDGVVTLRAYMLDDLDGCVEQCTDPESIAWTTVPAPYGRDDGVAWITKVVPQSWAERSDLAFAIEAEHHDGVHRFSGGISLRPREEGVAEIGFGLHPAARGRGAGRRAIALLCDWAFAYRGVEVIMWYAYVGNWASRKSVWANGFTFDGTISRYLLQRGERRDTWVGSLRPDDPREPTGEWFDPPVLESERLRLRPLVDSDSERLHELMYDERSMHFNGRVPGTRPATGELALLRAREQHATGTIMNWCIADRETDRLLGKIQLFDFKGLDDTEVKPGYAVHPDARGRGVLTEALTLLTDWVFRPVAAGGLGKRRITIGTAASNKASRHAAERAGYTHANTIRSGFSIGTHDFDDECLYERTNDSWRPEKLEL